MISINKIQQQKTILLYLKLFKLYLAANKANNKLFLGKKF